jgi:hypothetical protein
MSVSSLDRAEMAMPGRRRKMDGCLEASREASPAIAGPAGAAAVLTLFLRG